MDDQPVAEGLAGLLAEFRFLHARANRCRGTVSGLLAQRRPLPEIWDRGSSWPTQRLFASSLRSGPSARAGRPQVPRRAPITRRPSGRLFSTRPIWSTTWADWSAACGYSFAPPLPSNNKTPSRMGSVHLIKQPETQRTKQGEVSREPENLHMKNHVAIASATVAHILGWAGC